MNNNYIFNYYFKFLKDNSFITIEHGLLNYRKKTNLNTNRLYNVFYTMDFDCKTYLIDISEVCDDTICPTHNGFVYIKIYRLKGSLKEMNILKDNLLNKKHKKKDIQKIKEYIYYDINVNLL